MKFCGLEVGKDIIIYTEDCEHSHGRRWCFLYNKRCPEFSFLGDKKGICTCDNFQPTNGFCEELKDLAIKKVLNDLEKRRKHVVRLGYS